MPKRVILHAGVPKTGSTSIQRFLDANSDALREQGILYSPAADRPNRRDHNFLAMAFWEHVQRIYADRYGDDIEGLRRDSLAAWDQLLGDFRASDQDTLVISGEFFTRCPVKPLTEFVRDHLGDLDVTTLFYLRRPSSLYVSWTQQHIRGSNDLLPFTRKRARWSKKLRQWRRVGDVVVREFDRDSMVGGDVVSDFASILGADGPLTCPDDANESISAEGMELLLKHRRFHFVNTPDTVQPQTKKLLERIRRREQAFAEDLAFTKPRLHDELAAYLDSDVDELEKLERTFGFRYSRLPPTESALGGRTREIEGRRFLTIADMMPVNEAVIDDLQHQLELAGVAFSEPSTGKSVGRQEFTGRSPLR